MRSPSQTAGEAGPPPKARQCETPMAYPGRSPGTHPLPMHTGLQPQDPLCSPIPPSQFPSQGLCPCSPPAGMLHPQPHVAPCFSPPTGVAKHPSLQSLPWPPWPSSSHPQSMPCTCLVFPARPCTNDPLVSFYCLPPPPPHHHQEKLPEARKQTCLLPSSWHLSQCLHPFQ